MVLLPTANPTARHAGRRRLGRVRRCAMASSSYFWLSVLRVGGIGGIGISIGVNIVGVVGGGIGRRIHSITAKIRGRNASKTAEGLGKSCGCKE